MPPLYPDAPGYKERGGTSEEAAASIEAEAATLRGLAHRLLLKEQLTADEVARRLGRSVLAIRPRVSELGQQGLAVKTSERRLNVSGKAAVVWAGNPRGDGYRMTIPEVRHCLLVLANKVEAGEADDPHDTAAVLRYLAEQTRRAPRGSRKGADRGGEPPEQQAEAAE